jgi:Bifunctional DNA primase/polymerase, N-terminal/Primase C terminal 1 (PriCT-1)
MVSPLHRAATALAQKGMAVFPCVPRGKTPATGHGCLAATTDLVAIDRWWTADPGYNVAIATGTASGVFVLDIDGDGAELALAKFEAVNAPLPATVEVITGDGRHLWFRTPADVEVRNSASKIARGIDVRGDGGYILAPPSLHPSGRRYAWSVDSAKAIAEAPQWLLDKIKEQPGSNGTTTPPSEWRELATNGVVEGARNDTVARLTGHLLRRYVDPRLTLELVRTWNAARCRPPLSDRELEQVVQSIAGLELKRRAGHG